MREMMNFWAHELKWSGRRFREKGVIIWFGLSFAAVPLAAAAAWWLAVPALVNMWAASRAVIMIGGVEE